MHSSSASVNRGVLNLLVHLLGLVHLAQREVHTPASHAEKTKEKRKRKQLTLGPETAEARTRLRWESDHKTGLRVQIEHTRPVPDVQSG